MARDVPDDGLKKKILARSARKVPKVGKLNARLLALAALQAKREGETMRVEAAEQAQAGSGRPMPGPMPRGKVGVPDPRTFGA